MCNFISIHFSFVQWVPAVWEHSTFFLILCPWEFCDSCKYLSIVITASRSQRGKFLFFFEILLNINFTSMKKRKFCFYIGKLFSIDFLLSFYIKQLFLVEANKVIKSIVFFAYFYDRIQRVSESIYKHEFLHHRSS